MTAVSLLSDADDVVGSLTGIRRQILGCLEKPATATTIAKAMGTTRQRINYHLNALEDLGLIEVDEVRPRRGMHERVMRRIADTVIVSPTVFSGIDLNAKDTAGVAGVVSTASDLIRHVSVVANHASSDGKRLATATFDTSVRLASPAQLRLLIEEISNVIASHESESGLEFRITGFALPMEETPDGPAS